MAEKEPPCLCTVCRKHLPRDAFTPEDNSTCKNCSSIAIRYLEQRMPGLRINSQKNDGDLLEKGAGAEAGQMNSEASEKLEKQKPGKEIATVAVGGRVTPDIDRQKIAKPKMEDRILSAIKANQYFLIGVAKQDGTAEESLQKYELRTTNLYDRAISNYKVRVIQVFYTFMLGAENGYAVDTKQLRDKYLADPFCLNAKLGEDEFFREEGPGKGIAYLCVYCK